jgi:hypothetical protein
MTKKPSSNLHSLARRTARETAHLLLDLPVGVVGFTVVACALTTGVSLAITLAGVPLLAATMLLARRAADAERARARALLGVSLQAPPAPPAAAPTFTARLLNPLRDRSAWRASGYFLLMLPVGTATFSVAVAWWATAIFLATLPAWAWALPADALHVPDGPQLSSAWELAATSATGLLLLAVTPFVIHAVTAADRRLIRLLGDPLVTQRKTAAVLSL